MAVSAVVMNEKDSIENDYEFREKYFASVRKE